MKKIITAVLVAALLQSSLSEAHDRGEYYGAGLRTPRVYRERVVVQQQNDWAPVIAGTLIGAAAGYIAGRSQEPQYQPQYQPQVEYRVACEPVYRVVAISVDQYGQQQQVFQQVGCQ
jgi:Tfp pilus assembly protein PilX